MNYGQEKIHFTLPKQWTPISAEDKPPIAGVKDPIQEIKRALDQPIGSPRIEELARPGMEVVLLFDDLQRPTPVHLALPEILNRLNRAGIPDERISGICAVGTHPIPSVEQLETKVGNEFFSRLQGRIRPHDPHASDNVIIGKTHRGTLVEVNRGVAFADLIIGVGECMPHPNAGFGGGCKIIMPGVCSYRSVAEHHFTWMRHRNSKVNVMDGNSFYEEIVDAGTLGRLSFKLDFIINEKKEVIRAFAGAPVAEHREASRYASSLYLIPLKQAGSIMPLVKEMASAENAADFHRRLIEGKGPADLKSLGISYIMQVVAFKQLAENFNVVHVTDGISPEQVKMMKFSYAPNMEEAINQVATTMPTADVAIFPSGGTIIPEVAQRGS
jgi:nickel-dependent lactate racemase